jgi:hypothetical protein
MLPIPSTLMSAAAPMRRVFRNEVTPRQVWLARHRWVGHREAFSDQDRRTSANDDPRPCQQRQLRGVKGALTRFAVWDPRVGRRVVAPSC